MSQTIKEFDGNQDAYEFRYPEKGTNEQKTAWVRFVNWLAKNDPNPYDKVSHPFGYTEKPLKAVKKISFSNLVLIIALPFSPAFLINIACGLSKTDFKKFITAILIGKLSIIYFWGFVSKSLLESITDIKTLIIIVVLLIVSYALSKIVNKKLKFE